MGKNRRPRIQWWLAGLMVLLAFAIIGSEAYAENCQSAKSNVVFRELADDEYPSGYDPRNSACFGGSLTGTLKGKVTVCFHLADCYENLWGAPPPAGAIPMVYQATAFFETARGSFTALERGVMLDDGRYPDPRNYWAGVMEATAGEGIYAGVHGVVIVHNMWNRPSRASLIGELCMP